MNYKAFENENESYLKSLKRPAAVFGIVYIAY